MTLLWADYQKEKYDRQHLTLNRNGEIAGVIFYNVYDDGSCLVDTLFVKKAHRGKSIAQELERMLIKNEEITSIYCDIDMDSNRWEATLRGFAFHGYKTHNVVGNRIVLRKDLLDGKQERKGKEDGCSDSKDCKVNCRSGSLKCDSKGAEK